jgi:hypothetical protein
MLAAATAGSDAAAPATKTAPRRARRLVPSGKVRAFARTVALGHWKAPFRVAVWETLYDTIGIE